MDNHLMVCAAALFLCACERQQAPQALARAPTSLPRAVAALPAPVRSVEAPAPAPAASGTRLLPPAQLLADAAITANIQARLLTDPNMRGADVSVNIDQGVVHLTGTVQSQEQAAIASAHAQREDGVMRVDNSLALGAR